MLTIDISPSAKEKYTLFHMLKWHMVTCPMVKANVEENIIAAIYDEGTLCGGALLFGNKKSAYLYCFFENPDYFNEKKISKLESLIVSTFPEAVLFDVHCLKDNTISYSKDIIKNR